MNLLPVTDFYLMWRSKGQEWGTGGEDIYALDRKPSQSQRCALKPDLKQWQEITCHVEGQLASNYRSNRPPAFAIPTDPWGPWVDWVEIVEGSPPAPRFRPDVASSRVVPKVTIPEISQDGFTDTFKVLDECLVIDVPRDGFTHRFMAPGGYYGDHWYALDTSLTVNGAKWANQAFAGVSLRRTFTVNFQ